MTTIPSGFYNQIVNGFYGDISDGQKEALWQKFLDNYDLTADSTKINDPSTQQKFLGYIETNANLPSTIALSPIEVQKRTVMVDAFSLALQMLGTLQDTVVVQANNLTFYGRWQEEYTKMISSIPVYTPTQDGFTRPSVNPDAYDPSTFRFGYDDISMQSIADSIVAQSKNGTSGSGSFGLGSFSSEGSYLAFSLNRTSSTAYNWVVRLNLKQGFTLPSTADPSFSTLTTANPTATITNTSPPNSTTTVSLNFDGSYSVILSGNSSLTTDSDSAQAKNLTDSFKTIYYNILGNPITSRDPPQNPPAATIYKATDLPYIPWDPDLIGTDDKSTQRRTEVNSLLQQYIDIARSYRTAVQNRAQIVQNNLGVTREGLNQQSTLITSILKSFQTIVGGIFK